jgi:hypothetical protein
MGVTGLENDPKTPKKRGENRNSGVTGGRNGNCCCPIVSEIAELAAALPQHSREFVLVLVRQVAEAGELLPLPPPGRGYIPTRGGPTLPDRQHDQDRAQAARMTQDTRA